MGNFEAKSEAGSLQGAMDEAVRKALTTTSSSHPMVPHRLTQISQKKGGIANLGWLTVTIETHVP